MNSFGSRLRLPVFLLLVLFVISGCFPGKKMTIASVGSLLEDVAKASSKQSDLKLVREGMPAYLLLIDGMVEAWPGNDRLLMAAAQGYSSYALLLGDQDRAAARNLYGKAKRYALESLEARGFRKPAETPFDDFKEGLSRLGKKDIPYIFWAAACWAGWISLDLGSMEALAELPRVESMMKRVLVLDESFHYGGAHLFMGIWFASRPKGYGGDLKMSQQHFLKAIELGEGKFLMAYVYYASDYARKAGDQGLFRSLLEKVQATPADVSPELTLSNTIAKSKADELMLHIDDYFD
jgi:hypothetical protein